MEGQTKTMVNTMMVDVRTDVLRGALDVVKLAIEARTAMPILSCVRIVVEGRTVRLTGTDLETAVTVEVPVEVEARDGQCVVECATLAKVIGRCKGETVTLAVEVTREEKEVVMYEDDAEGNPVKRKEVKVTETTVLAVRSRTQEYTVKVLDPDDYPVVPCVGDTDTALLTIPTADVLTAIERVGYAMSRDDTRYNLNAVCVEVDREANTLRWVTTDGHRMAVYEYPCATLPVVPCIVWPLYEEIIREREIPSWLLPRCGVEVLVKAAKKKRDKGTMDWYITKGSVLVRMDGMVVAMRLVEGNFPAWRSAVPRDVDVHLDVKVRAADLVDAVQGVMAVLDTRQRSVKVCVKGDALWVSASSDGRTAKECVAVRNDGAEVTCGLHGKYFTDALTHGGSVEVTLRFNRGELRPIIVKHDWQTWGLVMPMRL